MNKDAPPRMIVSSSAREPLEKMYPPEGNLPALITDARENPLVQRRTDEGTVLVKSPAFPYVEHHMLIIPDKIDGGSTQSITEVPEKLLSQTLQMVGAVAEHYEDNSDIKEINIGWNHSPLENKKHVATQVNILHIHVTGYTEDDINHTVSYDDVRNRPELRIKEREPLQGVIAAIAQNEVFAPLEERTGFSDRFHKVENEQKVTYEMVQGKDAFGDPSLATTMQEIHERTAKAYDAIASCFFERDTQNPTQFAETEDFGQRFALLPTRERIDRIHTYISKRSYLTEAQQRQLRYLASQSMSMNEIHTVFQLRKGDEPLTEDEKYGRNPAMALKGLAYAVVMTGVRQEDSSFLWRLGFDPVVFAPRDVIQATRGTFSHFERQVGAIMPTEALQRMEEDEAKLVQKLTAV